ncbi:MAG: phosphoribosylformylglycinamidine synthase subunit PurS [Candidatus Brockarchaeota archaeon]|nr:phosphoribosylformylglycinamidine synthase subunit PurS [Candidatus Brockarchaeota archaeon]
MRFQARVEVSLKPGYSDPEGNAVKRSLKELRYDVDSVKVSKVYRIVLDSDSKEAAEKTLEEMCKRLLANPTRDDYEIHIEGEA